MAHTVRSPPPARTEPSRTQTGIAPSPSQIPLSLANQLQACSQRHKKVMPSLSQTPSALLTRNICLHYLPSAPALAYYGLAHNSRPLARTAPSQIHPQIWRFVPMTTK